MSIHAARQAPTRDANPPGAAPPLRRRHTHDADELAACLGGWNQVYEQLAPGRFDGRFVECRIGELQVFREQTNQPLYEAGAVRADQHVVGVPVRMHGVGRYAHLALGPHSVLSVRGGSELDFRVPDVFDIVAVALPGSLLQAHAEGLEARPFEPAASPSVLQPAQPSVQALRCLLLATLETASRQPASLTQVLQSRLQQALLAATLRVLLPAATADAPPPGQRHALVARARAYMREHVDQPLSVEDLCRVLRVSRRTLQYSFQDVLQTNPAAYLRTLRLNGARRSLRRADPATLNVADVAARWGFWHLSRFATDYRRMFGELPSQTLHRVGGD